MKNKRRTTISSLNAKTALETIKEQLTLSELAQKHQLHPDQMGRWKKEISRKMPNWRRASVASKIQLTLRENLCGLTGPPQTILDFFNSGRPSPAM